MNKLLLLLCLVTGTATKSNAQNEKAKIKYEQAEKAFDQEDYKTTIEKLDEAKELLKTTNSKMLYLRIQALRGIVNGTGDYEYEIVEQLRRDLEYFIKEYENEDPGKFKEISLSYEKLKERFPNRAAYEKMKFEKQKEIEEVEKNRKLTEKCMNALMEKFLYKPNVTLDELRAYNSEVATLTRKKNQKVPGLYMPIGRTETGFVPVGPNHLILKEKDPTRVLSYQYQIACSKTIQEPQEKFYALFDSIPVKGNPFIKKEIENSSGIINIKMPGKSTLITIQYGYDYNFYNTTIKFVEMQ